MIHDDHEPLTPRHSAPADETTPAYPQAPEVLSPSDVRRIERLLGRPPRNVELALAEQYRRGGADLSVIVAQVAVDLHDVKRPVGWAVKIGLALLAGVAGGALYVGNAIWGASERNTAVEYRLQACERQLQRLDGLLYRPAFPIAGPTPGASSGPVP
jgi:hypothetical protein